MERVNREKKEYGDWQTHYAFALSVCRKLKAQGVSPQVIVEPTCGKGNFILAALEVFDEIEVVYGVEIFKPYIAELEKTLSARDEQSHSVRVELIHENVFNFDFRSIKVATKGKRVLVLGNPPWVTNSKLGEISSDNLPSKMNFKNVKGLDAMTGKGNFDIAESICYHLFETFASEDTTVALLVKTSVVKNILFEQLRRRYPISSITQQDFDAKREFGVAVSAALMTIRFHERTYAETCSVSDFYSGQYLRTMGWTEGKFVSDLNAYTENAFLDGTSPISWRSGIKHDCARVMELTKGEDCYFNKEGERVDIEDDLVYPLVKSSDIGEENISTTRRYVIVPQHRVGEDTAYLKTSYPKTYRYLSSHIDDFRKRKSSIYASASDFSIFGIGDYSFKPYKVAISGLYKHTTFTIVMPVEGKPAMLDDTCYSIGFDTLEEAEAAKSVLNSPNVQAFIRSLMFQDTKRVITKDLLMRIDLYAAIDENHFVAKQKDNSHHFLRKILLMKYPRVASLF